MSPAWQAASWLPELELIKWERLERRRAEQVALTAAYRRSLGTVPALERRFAAEDEAQREAIRDSVATGAPEREVAVTSQQRRDVELQVARDAAAPALHNLAEHVIATVIELTSHWSEATEAYHAALGQPTRAEFEAEELTREGRAIEAMHDLDEQEGGATIEQVNAALAKQPSRRPPFIQPQVRQRIEDEYRRLEGLHQGPLSADGVNTIAEVQAFVAQQTGEDLATPEDLQRHLHEAIARRAGEVLDPVGAAA